MNENRMAAVAKYIDGECLIDIGTDHGYLIIDTLQSNKIKSAIAVEITQGPLDNVKTNIYANNLQTQTQFFKSDGLLAVPKSVVDTADLISICGMGGNTIVKIIEESIEKISTQKLILQPNNAEYQLRNFLMNNSFKITAEKVIADNDIFYEILVCERCDQNQLLSEEQLMLGAINLKENSQQFKLKCLHQLAYFTKLEQQIIANNNSSEVITKKREILERITNENK